MAVEAEVDHAQLQHDHAADVGEELHGLQHLFKCYKESVWKEEGRYEEGGEGWGVASVLQSVVRQTKPKPVLKCRHHLTPESPFEENDVGDIAGEEVEVAGGGGEAGGSSARGDDEHGAL